MLGELTGPIGDIVYEVLGDLEEHFLDVRVDSFPR